MTDEAHSRTVAFLGDSGVGATELIMRLIGEDGSNLSPRRINKGTSYLVYHDLKALDTLLLKKDDFEKYLRAEKLRLVYRVCLSCLSFSRFED